MSLEKVVLGRVNSDSNWSPPAVTHSATPSSTTLKVKEIIGKPTPSSDRSAGELVPYNIRMKNAAQAGNLSGIEAVFNLIISAKLKPDLFTYTPMLKAYARARRWDEVTRIWSKMEVILKANGELSAKNAVPLKCGLYAFACFGVIDKVKAIMSQVSQIVNPDHEIYSYLLMAYSIGGQPENVHSTLVEMEKNGFQMNEKDYVDLIVAYGKSGNPEGAQKAFNEFSSKHPTLVSELSCNELAEAYLKINDLNGIQKVIGWMKGNGVRCSDRIYNAVIRYFIKVSDPKGALDAFSELKKAQIQPSALTYSHVLHACSKKFGYGSQAQAVYDEMKSNGFRPDNLAEKYLVDSKTQLKRYTI